MILDAKSYPEFKKELLASDCSLCGLAAGRTRLVVDRGNPAAKVLFVGEAPGEKEDLAGKAFVGRSGRLLDEMLRKEGFETDRDALIANVVKCRPPDNRRPSPQEAASCLPFLRKQIELVGPRWIALLGATAVRHLVPDRKSLPMEDQVGAFFKHSAYPGIQLIALYHPAYILRDPRKRPLMETHLRRLCDSWRRGQ